MNYLTWHWHILSDPDVVFGLDPGVWGHLFWLVEQEKYSTIEWKGGKWRMKHDNVSHPKHYTGHASGIECIQITEHMNFCRGNAIKYIWRAGEKGSELEDLHKAKWYIEREIQRLMGSPAIQQDAQHEQEEWERVKFGQAHAD